MTEKTENKILYIASSASHIVNFHNEYLKELCDIGFEIHTAVGGDISEINKINASKNFVLKFEKNKNILKNIAVIFKLSKIIRREQCSIISTQSTLAGFAGRLAVFFNSNRINRNRNRKVFHTCHGYLFNDNASLKSKVMILIERLLSRRTDLLFVMNQDDYNIAKKYKLCGNIKYINGMGLNPAKFAVDSEINLFKKYKIPEQKKYFLCVGEFSKRKNQHNIIFALKLVQNIKDIHVIFLGDGVLLDECKKLSTALELHDSVTFCGHVSEPTVFYRLAECVISASRFEGLPFNILEALYFNKPVIASNVKGHKDLIKDSFNGYLFDYGDNAGLARLIEKIAINENYDCLKNNAVLEKKYLFENVKQEILEEYINYEKTERLSL